MTDDLLQSWTRLMSDVGGRDEESIRRSGAALLRRWEEPHRRYHDVAHLRAVLAAIDVIGDDDPSIAADHLDEARRGAWFHDAVHDGVAGVDERASAEVALATLVSLGATTAAAHRVAALVLVTVDHDPTSAPVALREAAAVLCDADLAVLGATEADYDRYAAAVRAEYASVTDADFARGRRQVLTELHGSARLFATDAARRRWNARAHANLSREIARLARQDGA